MQLKMSVQLVSCLASSMSAEPDRHTPPLLSSPEASQNNENSSPRLSAPPLQVLSNPSNQQRISSRQQGLHEADTFQVSCICMFLCVVNDISLSLQVNLTSTPRHFEPKHQSLKRWLEFMETHQKLNIMVENQDCLHQSLLKRKVYCITDQTMCSLFTQYPMYTLGVKTLQEKKKMCSGRYAYNHIRFESWFTGAVATSHSTGSCRVMGNSTICM